MDIAVFVIMKGKKDVIMIVENLADILIKYDILWKL